MTLADYGTLCGSSTAMWVEFKEYYSRNPPPEAGTPDYQTYRQQLDDVAKAQVAEMKGAKVASASSVLSTPEKAAEFQTMQFHGALDLSAAQIQQVDAALVRYYAESFAQEPNPAMRLVAVKDTDVPAVIRPHLTPEQQGLFDKYVREWAFTEFGSDSKRKK